MEYIKTRKSVRTFTGEKLKEQDVKKINEYISDKKNLIGINGNIVNIELKQVAGVKGEKIGTYGFIKDSPAFLIAICKNTQEYMLDCGYVLEKLILFLHKNGLGTCWLGGTFNRNQFDVKDTYGDDAYIPVISPVGYEAQKKSISEKMTRSRSKADLRNEFDTMFFYKDFNTKLENQDLRDTMEYVRRAPSASNKQPWRVILSEDGVANFYLERTPNYVGAKLSYDIQWLDIGIALAHYELASNKNTYFIEKPKVDMISEYTEYVVSVK